MANKVFISLTLSISKDEKNHQWLGECKELGTSTFGDSVEEVAKELEELVALHLNTLEDVEERSRFFVENNIIMYYESVPQEIEVRKPSKPDVFIKSFNHQLVHA